MKDNKELRDTIHELLVYLDPIPLIINDTTDTIMNIIKEECKKAYRKGRDESVLNQLD